MESETVSSTRSVKGNERESSLVRFPAGISYFSEKRLQILACKSRKAVVRKALEMLSEFESFMDQAGVSIEKQE